MKWKLPATTFSFILPMRSTVVRSKWTSMAASILLQCLSGSAYCFGIYSPLLKSTQLYDQQTLDTVAFFKDFGANVGVISGAIYSSSPDGSHPRLVLGLGSFQCFVGYFLMWLSVTGVLYRPHVSLMCLFMLMASHSSTFFNTANVVTAAHNFPDHRGTAIGIVKGYLGLSGAIIIQLYRTVYGDNPSNFLLLISLMPTTCAIIVMYFVRVYPTGFQDERPLLNALSVIALITALYLMAIIILETILALGFSFLFPTLLLLLMLIASPAVAAINGHLRDLRVPSDSRGRALLTNATDLVEDSQQKCCEAEPDEVPSIGSILEIRLTQNAVNLTLFEAMQTGNFWLMFAGMACGMGSGLATVNNISQIGTSLGYKSTETSTLVSLWSIWNFMGRFGAGYISDHFLRSGGFSRPLFMVITLAAMSSGHALISSGLPGALHLGYVVVGVTYGSQWSLMPTIASEIFGLTHFGTIFNAIAIASPCGSYLLSVRVVGYIYDMESRKRSCVGNHCFMLSFLIMAFVSLLGSGAALALFFRTKMFYEQNLYARLHNFVD